MKESSRFELRINSDLKRKFKKFCKDKNINLSEAMRQAVTEYIGSMSFVYSLVEHLQNQEFHDAFYNFYIMLPKELKHKLDDLLEPEEEELVKKTPPQLLRNVRVITDKGRGTLKHNMGQLS